MSRMPVMSLKAKKTGQRIFGQPADVLTAASRRSRLIQETKMSRQKKGFTLIRCRRCRPAAFMERDRYALAVCKDLRYDQRRDYLRVISLIS